jgi:hypothetical protein
MELPNDRWHHMKRTNVYIVGAGFSHYSGLPLQKDFTEALLAPRGERAHPMQSLIKYLGTFVHEAFDHGENAKAAFWPNLEDVFTNIDLAANTGHHLGAANPPSHLRTTRRVLLARMMSMLHERYEAAKITKSADWKRLNKFFKAMDVDRGAFISMNWDTVIERRLRTILSTKHFDYGCEAIAASFDGGDDVISVRHSTSSKGIPVVKMHGSVNWLYCDNCRQLYWFSPMDGQAVALQIITKNEAKKFALAEIDECERWKCPTCPTVPLTTRLATFSFLKALDFPMFDKSWLSAERLLRDASKWVFIGYSLPAADYEFKHLLKRVQLSREEPPEFVVITGGATADETYLNYQRFFGRRIRKQDNFFSDGLSDAAIIAAHE